MSIDASHRTHTQHQCCVSAEITARMYELIAFFSLKQLLFCYEVAAHTFVHPLCSLSPSAAMSSPPSSSSSLPLSVDRIPIILLGCGNVAVALLAQISLSAHLHQKQFGMKFDLLAIADSSGFVLAKSEGDQTAAALTQQQIDSILEWKVRNHCSATRMGVNKFPHSSALLTSLMLCASLCGCFVRPRRRAYRLILWAVLAVRLLSSPL